MSLSAKEGASGARLSWATRLGYGSGQTGLQILRDMPNVLLPGFITLVLGLPAAWMSLIIFLPKLWIVLFDPWIGARSDRTVTRLGRRRPFMLIGALLCPLALIALFYAPPGGVAFRVAYACLMFAAALTAASIFSVPHLSLAAELSSSSFERAKLMSARNIFLALGLVAGIGGSQVLISRFGHGAPGYFGMALVLAAVCLVSMLTCFLTTPTEPRLTAPVQPVSLRRQWAIVRGNRPFVVLTRFHLVHLFAASSGTTAFIFFMIYVVGNALLLLPMTLLAVLVIIAVQPVWLAAARRLGPKTAYIVAVCGWSIVSLSWMLVRRDTVPFIDLPLIGSLTLQELGVLGRHVLIAGFNTGITLLSLSMLTDTVEHDREIIGEAREGAYVGAWSAFEKIALAAGPLWVGPFLQILGFASGGGGHGHGGDLAPQSESALWAIRLAAAGIPALLCLGTIPLVLRYPLGRRA